MKRIVPCYCLCLLSVLFFSCSEKKLYQHKEWKDFFSHNGVRGCLMLHDYYGGRFDVYGLGALQNRVLPAETFHIMLALAGLETGVITDTNMVISDSTAGKNLAGLTMAEAFRSGNTAYFQWVARKIRAGRMQYWLDSTYYGNRTIGSDLTTCWVDNTLRISPDEQMGLMEKLYQGRLAFQPRTQRLVKGLLIRKISRDDTLYYQQGAGTWKEKKIGWLTGWLMKKDEPHFFVIKTVAPDSISNLYLKDLNILYNVLDAKGLVSEIGGAD